MALSYTSANISQIPSNFSFYDPGFFNITGPTPKLEVILQNESYPFAHEASVFDPKHNELWMSSNQFTDPVTNETTIVITKVNVGNGSTPVTSEIVNAAVPMANGGVNHDGGVLWCGQGTLNETGGLFQMSVDAPYHTELLLGNFYGRQFTSINDVIVHSDGSIWFTDPIYGYEQGIRPSPKLPNQVYRFDPKTKAVRVVADGFDRPNGITFSPDYKTIYITDTGETVGDGSFDYTKPATIYAYDVTTIHGQLSLTNRRVFAMATYGIPDGIKTDLSGNVYAGCGDGVSVWSSGGVLLGKILIDGGGAQFSFGRNGEMFILSENKLYSAQLASSVKGSILRI